VSVHKTLEVILKRRLLISATICILAIGAGIAAVPFLKSLSPNDKGRASLLQVDLSDLAIGHVKVIELPKIRIYLERLPPDEVVALIVPVKDGAVLMVNGGSFRCRDADVDADRIRLWNWDAAGRYAGPQNVPFDDIPRAGVERHSSFVLLRVPNYF
jgi:hypothetical protein